MYGPIKRVKIIRDNDSKSRGYAFVEYEHKSDFKDAYKRADRKRIDDSRINVDYERGRTEKNWKPRRLGGGKGDSRNYPAWLEKELNEVKDFFADLLYINRKEKDQSPKRKRSRSRHAEEEKKDSIEITNTNYFDVKIQEEGNGHQINHTEMLYANENEILSSNNDEEHKKKKKEKKEKKSKKEKKAKKEKKEKKEKRIAREEGEII